MRRPRLAGAPRALTFATTAPVALLLALAGCGGSGGGGFGAATLYPVKGEVMLAAGKPLTTGQVEFLPVKGGMPATGLIGSDGGFSLKTGDGRDGAPAGDYKVRIEPTTVAARKGGGGKPAALALPFPIRFTDEDGNTGLTATVKAEPTTLEPFTLSEVKGGGKAPDKARERN